MNIKKSIAIFLLVISIIFLALFAYITIFNKPSKENPENNILLQKAIKTNQDYPGFIRKNILDNCYEYTSKSYKDIIKSFARPISAKEDGDYIQIELEKYNVKYKFDNNIFKDNIINVNEVIKTESNKINYNIKPRLKEFDTLLTHILKYDQSFITSGKLKEEFTVFQISENTNGKYFEITYDQYQLTSDYFNNEDNIPITISINVKRD